MTDLAKIESKHGPSELQVAASYQYKPLPSHLHTRVLVLEPGPEDDSESPLIGSLRPLDLDDPNSEPFEAISYVWGPSAKTHVILVDGHPLRITASLRGALLQTRRPDRSRTLWADAICIKQSDKTEKGHQVSAMGRIYKTSIRTLICLGVQDPEHAQNAAGLIEEVNIMIQNVQRDPDFSGEADSFPFPAENDPIILDSRWEAGWNVMLEQPWFRRGWVVQEASLGSDACVLWSHFQIGWLSILRVPYWLFYRGYSAFRSQGTEVPVVLRSYYFCSFARRHPEEARSFGENPRITNLATTLSTMFGMHWLELSDPRDRIYAFMALDTSDGILADLQLDPDYNRPYLEIYHDFAVKYIKTGDLNILSFIAHKKESLAGSTTAEAIPSWVPRWDLQSYRSHPVSANLGDHPKAFTFTEQGSVLRVRGLLLGSVEDSATATPYCLPDRKSLALQNVISLWSEVVAASRMNEGPYNGRQAFAFFDVLCPNPVFVTSEEWSTRREDFARYLQSYMPGPERNSAMSISQSNEPVTEQHSLKILAEAIRTGGTRRFVILSRGYYGVAPPITQKGDVFALVYGSKTLSILRPAKGKPGHYQIIGPVYVESKTVLNPHRSNMMGVEGCRDWEGWGLTEEDINLY